MDVEAFELPPREAMEFDVVIVGAGPGRSFGCHPLEAACRRDGA